MYYEKLISKYKYLELEANAYKSATYFSLGFDLTYRRKVDHGGISGYIDLIFVTLSFNLYDTRHWDQEQNKYEETK